MMKLKSFPLKWRSIKPKRSKRKNRDAIKKNIQTFMNDKECPIKSILMEELHQRETRSWKLKNDKLRTDQLRIPAKSLDGSFQMSRKVFHNTLGIKNIPSTTHLQTIILWPVEAKDKPPRSLDEFFKNEEHTSEELSRSMNIEMLRLVTFRNFPRALHTSAIRLAAAGFFYKGHGERVECYSCGFIFGNWTESEDPYMVHRRSSPQCRHVCNQDDTNVRIQNGNSRHAESDMKANQTTIPPQDLRRQSNTMSSTHTISTNSSLHTKLSSVSPSNPQTTEKRSDALQTSSAENDCNNAIASDLMARSTLHATVFQQSDSIQDYDKNKIVSNKERPKTNFLLHEMSMFGSNQSKAKPWSQAFAAIKERITSFGHWPLNLAQTPGELALAGFYYVGIADFVRCFFCGGGLRDWDEGDNPWVEHARWFPRCAFLRQNKGDQFVALVQEQHTRELSQTDETGVNGNDRESDIRINGQREEEKENIMESAAVLSNIEMGYTTDQISRALEKAKSLNIGQSELTAVEILDFLMEEETSNDSVTKASGQWMDDSLSYEIKCLKEKNQQYMDQRLCKICMDKEVHIAMLPCGHLYCCVHCGPAMRKCPICRTCIKGTVKVWFA